MPRVLAVLACFAAVCWCAILPAASEAAPRETHGRPVVLLFPPGGFLINVLAAPWEERMARRAGFRPRFVDYPEYDFPGAVRTAFAAAREERRAGHRVYAYGESAGGTLAGLLAEQGLAAGAAVYCPIADMVEYTRHQRDPELYQQFIQASDRDLRRYSPGLHDSVLPILAMRGIGDAAFMNRAIRRWDERGRPIHSVAVRGGHLASHNRRLFRRNVRRAFGWLAGAAGLG